MVAEVKKYNNGSIRIKLNNISTDFFNVDEYIIKLLKDVFSISKPDLDYRGRLHKVNRKKESSLSIFTAKDIEDGIYILDEDSNEDIYLFFKKQ